MKDFMERCLHSAKEELNDTGQVAVVTYVRPSESGDFSKEFSHEPNGKKPMATMPYSASSGDKDDWYQMIGMFVQRFGAEFSVMVAESWYSENPETDDEGIPKHTPSEDPNRKECIVIMAVKYDSGGLITDQLTVMQPFEREGKEITYLEEKRLGGSGEEGRSRLADVTARQDLV